MSEWPSIGESVRALSYLDGTRTVIVGAVYRVNDLSESDCDGDTDIWIDADDVEVWVSGETPTIRKPPTGEFGVTLGEESSNKYTVRVDSEDGFCNPLGELEDFAVCCGGATHR